MAKKMLINALHAEEARVAIVEDGRLVELDVEIAGNEQIRGNIYKGVVVRVEPGLQAAFVDIGLKKLGFLQMGELHPDNWKWRDDVPEEQRHKRPRIQEVLRRGQELIVQVEKGERENKGSALTTYASLPGRYMVLMPGSDSSGISRKVESESERKKLKELIAEMQIPAGYGYIIRTEAVGRTRDELQRDLDALVALYQGVREQGESMKGAGLIYQESSLIVRTIRDYFSAEIDEVLVDSKDVFKEVRDCLRDIDPQHEKIVKLHQEKRPIFSRYQLEEQIDLIYEKKVPLKSGGSIFIEPTEALVSIDVNSGKSTGEKGVEDTAFKTNLEAAEEAARQLRLRDLGGLIVIDFIDMRDRKHNAEVERTLKTALKADKARVNVARISEFGLLEMSRQRIRQTLHQASTLECPHCDGRGKVKSVEAMALSFLRRVHAAAAKGVIAEVVGSLPLEVAYYLLNRKRHELSRIENDYDIQVTVKGKPSYLLNQMELELVRREKLSLDEISADKAAVRVAKEDAAEGAPAPQEGRKKKKRKGKGPAEVEAPAAPAEEELVEPLAAAISAPVVPFAPVSPLEPEEIGAEHAAVAEGEQEEHKKKRRRRRKRGKGAAAEGAEGAAAMEGAPAPEFAAEAVAGEHAAAEPEEGAPLPEGGEGAAESHAEEGKKKRRRKRRRGGKGGEAAAAEAAEAAAEAILAETAAETAIAETATAEAGEAPGEEEGAIAEEAGAVLGELPLVAPSDAVAVSSPAELSGSAPEKPKRRPRRKKGAAAAPESQPHEEAAAPVPQALEAEVAAAGAAPVEAIAVAAAQEAVETPAAQEEPAAKEKRKRAPRRAKGAPAQPEGAAAAPEAAEAAATPEVAPAQEAPSPEEGAPAQKRGRRKKAEPAQAAAGAAPEAPVAAAEPAAEKPKKKRAPRKKKEEAPEGTPA